MNLNRLAQTLASLLLFICALPPFAAGQKINTSYISTAPSSSSVLWVAKEVKLFDKHGIDATVIFISGSIRGIQSILAGEIPIGEGGGPGLASARLAGGDVVAVAGNINVLPYYLVAHPSIKRAEDLRGKIGGSHIAGGEAVGVELVRIQPDPHRVLAAKYPDVANPGYATERIDQIGGDVIGDVVLGHAAVF